MLMGVMLFRDSSSMELTSELDSSEFSGTSRPYLDR